MTDEDEEFQFDPMVVVNPFEGLTGEEAQELAKQLGFSAQLARMDILQNRDRKAEDEAGLKRVKEEQDRQRVLRPGAASTEDIQAAQRKAAQLRKSAAYSYDPAVQREVAKINRWVEDQFRKFRLGEKA